MPVLCQQYFRVYLSNKTVITTTMHHRRRYRISPSETHCDNPRGNRDLRPSLYVYQVFANVSCSSFPKEEMQCHLRGISVNFRGMIGRVLQKHSLYRFRPRYNLDPTNMQEEACSQHDKGRYLYMKLLESLSLTPCLKQVVQVCCSSPAGGLAGMLKRYSRKGSRLLPVCASRLLRVSATCLKSLMLLGSLTL